MHVMTQREPPVHLLATSDGVPIGAFHDPSSGADREPATGADPAGADLCLVVAHGFTLTRRRPAVRAIVEGFRAVGGVVSFDFRGHGDSGGASTVGDLEVLDLAAAVRWARELGYRWVVTVGWSMGASVAVRHAAGCHQPGPDDPGHRVDAVVSVSGPSRWHFKDTTPMRLLHRGVETATGRVVMARAFGTRIAGADWEPPPPEPPDAVAGRIAPVPLLVVHGDADRYFPLDHARWLVRAAGPTAQLWIEPGFGHAEEAAGPDLVGRIAAWADAAVAARGGSEPGAASARMPA
jgi:pimeloyl-ACP methyl ester carboxylesterase